MTTDAPEPTTRSRATARRITLAAAWVIGFLLFFYSLPLPNNPGIVRLQVWRDLPAYLFDLAAGSAERDAAGGPGWQTLPQRFDLAAVAGAILAGAWGLGGLLQRAVAPETGGSRLERAVIAFGMGLSWLSLLTLGFGFM